MSPSRPGAPRTSTPDSGRPATSGSGRPATPGSGRPATSARGQAPRTSTPPAARTAAAKAPRTPASKAPRTPKPGRAARTPEPPGRKRPANATADRGRASSRPGGPAGPGRASTSRNRIEPAKPISTMVSAMSWRVVVIVGVVILAAAVVLPSLRAYFRQEEELAALRADAVAAQEEVDNLHGEVARWDDPAYVMAQARERLWYVYPGETPYRVIDPETVVGTGDGSPTPAEVAKAQEEGTWYTRLWGTFDQAGATSSEDSTSLPTPSPVATPSP